MFLKPRNTNMKPPSGVGSGGGASEPTLFKFARSLLFLSTYSLVLISLVNSQVPNAQAMQQVASMQPTFIKDMNLATIKENLPIGEVVYTLEAQLENPTQGARILYSLEGTRLFSVDKFTGVVRVAQPIDREQTSDIVRFQVIATAFYNPAGQQVKLQQGSSTQLNIEVFILDENDNPPKIERVRIGRTELDSAALTRQVFGLSPNLSGGSQRSQIVRTNVSESTPVRSVIVDLIEAVDVDKASSNPLRSECINCEPEFQLLSTNDNLLNDRLNLSIVLINPLVHIPRNNIRQLQVIINDGKFNSTILFEITIDDIQNMPPQFIGSTTCNVHENTPIDKTIMTLQAVDGDVLDIDDVSRAGAFSGRQILYELQPAQDQVMNDDFKLHPLTGQLQIANRLDREAYLSLNDVIRMKVRARELTVNASSIIQQDDRYDSILEKLSPYVDQSPDAIGEADITVILIDVNDNEPHWLNASEIAELNLNQSPEWHKGLPKDRDTGRIYVLEIKENSLAGTPITTKNEMFVYDLDSGDNAKFNISLMDPFNLFDVEPKQVSGFALVSLKLANNKFRQPLKLLDYENPNNRSFIIQLIATETNTRERFSSKAQVQINVIDINDNVPEFSEPSYRANIREDAPPGKTVLLVQATDKDEMSRHLTFSLHGRSAYLFDINRHSGLITVARCEPVAGRARTRPCIDYEHQVTHHLMVEVSDGELSSKVPLTIYIEDASDNPPVFALSVVDVVIEEGSERLDPPIRIEATDADQSSVITYSIVEGNFEGLFSINNATGELQLTRPIRISHDELTSGGDYRHQQLNKMILTVQATDGVFSTNGTIRIDVLDANDNAPRFIRPHYSVEIPESIPAGQVVATVRAIDSDRGNNARVSYRLQRGSYGQFEIDGDSGVISVSQQAREFDSSLRENYTLEVVAFDHGLVSKSSSVLVHVRVLDTFRKAPEFEPQIQRATVFESSRINFVIHRMSVAEQDQLAKLTFEPGPIEGLDKNGQQVASAADSDRLNNMFGVATDTGDVMVSSNLDHDLVSFVNLTVYVSWKPLVPTASNLSDLQVSEYRPRSVGYLMINIIDDNSNPPIFAAPWSREQSELYYQMLEDLPVGSILTQLMASDQDSKISHFKIEPANEYFELTSPQSGVIVNRKLIDYDTLMSKTFMTPGAHRSSLASSTNQVNHNIIQFNVLVYDSGIPQLSAKATVSVEILPLNDNDCKFEQSIYEVRVKENAQPDTVVLQVRANDLDYGEAHNTIRYQLIGDHSEFFNLDARTGLITVSNKGSVSLDRERLSQSKFALTVIGRDEQQQQQQPQMASHIQTTSGLSKQLKAQQQTTGRTCSATIKVSVDDVNDNPPLFAQKLYEVTAYDTDAVDVPLIKLIIRDDDFHNSQNVATKTGNPVNSYKIISGNVNDIFNITNTGLIYATKPLNESLTATSGPVQLRVQVKQQSTLSSNALTSFTDECLVRINFVKINRYGPEWRFDSPLKAIVVEENSKPGTLVTQLRCIDRDYESRGSNRLAELENTSNSAKSSPIRYWIKDNGTNVIETSEFKLDSVTGNLVTRVELDREAQEFYQLIVVCEDNGKPQSLENVVPLYVTVLDVDDNKPEFMVSRTQESSNVLLKSSRQNSKNRPSISFSVEEHQSKGLPVGEIKAIDRDLDSNLPISYCLIEGDDFQEFSLDRVTGILYTNQTLDREKQSFYDLLVKAINDGSSCEDHMITQTVAMQNSNNSSSRSANLQSSSSRNKRSLQQQLEGNDNGKRSTFSLSYLSIKVDVLDINDNAPVFKKPIYRAGVHHRSLMNTLVMQVAAFDPDSGLNGTLSYKITEILMYKTTPAQHQTPSRARYDVNNEHQVLSKPIKLIQSPFRIDQQGNLYTQQLLTQYQLMSMFVIQIEATEQAEPWRTARTKLEVYVYETSSQLRIRINLHPRVVEVYRGDIETLLSNATKYTAIINRARSYHEAFDTPGASFKSPKTSSSTSSKQLHQTTQPSSNIDIIEQQLKPVPSIQVASGSEEPSYSNIHLIFVDNFRIVNPNLVMEKFDLTSAQLFMPQLLTQLQSANTNSNSDNRESQNQVEDSTARQQQPQQQLQVNEVSSLIDKIALASVQSAEYHGSSSAVAGIDWLESPSVLYVAFTILLILAGFVTFLFGCCCCTSRIKDHIIKEAMNKLVAQQNLQAKINEQVLAATNQASNGQEFILRQGGFKSSFDATKGCIANNNENMNILQRAMESGEYIDPNYTTLNGHLNMGAHYYDDSELEQQQVANGTGRELEVGTSKQLNGSVDSFSAVDIEEDGGAKDLNNGHSMKKSNGVMVGNGTNHQNHLQHHQRQRQQIPLG